MASLPDVVMSWLELAQATGEFKMLWSGEISVILCPYATPLWRKSSTRCGDHMGCWKGGCALRPQASRIIGQHGGSWTVVTSCTLFVQRMPPPRSMTNSKWSSRPQTSLSRDIEWHTSRAT